MVTGMNKIKLIMRLLVCTGIFTFLPMNCQSWGLVDRLVDPQGQNSGVLPDIPVYFQAIPGNGEIMLSWGWVPKATSYNIYWSNTPGVALSTGSIISGILYPQYTHTNLHTHGAVFYYTVTAVNEWGEGYPSLEISVTNSYYCVLDMSKLDDGCVLQ